jgi:hypothetical protein
VLIGRLGEAASVSHLGSVNDLDACAGGDSRFSA